ncbi:BadF/BadG/BcrA/BcrD ATPase family protein [uncultured Paraglaciecola sp.]|uniref:BadF/BadG/BcrA/BcrD ATPase family protein n=1 Tax=uncultured Paraglaciecola sp. TaxID=1765024 RepID=UPI00262BC179|nr:BadF/BadG/BcrA/BcrD ATPase family protein [uncultured Paraglaciecola sp.]
MKRQQYFIGVDGGGTKCKARVESADGQVIGEGLSGPANPVQGLQPALDSILDASQQAIANAGLAADSIALCHGVLGLAGVNLPFYRQQVQQWAHPFASCHVTTDLYIASMGAHNGQDGAIIIAGTGFNAGMIKQQQYMGIGGHGFILGDNGSGARIGVEAIRSTLEYLDGIRQESPLLLDIMAKLKAKNANAIVEQAIDQSPGYYAQFAPLVFEHAKGNDPAALQIITAVAHFISRIVKRLQQDEPARCAMIGGIAEPLYPWLDKQTQSYLSQPLYGPEMGAVIHARQLFAHKTPV